MEEAPEMIVLDPSSGLPAFLTRFDFLKFNSLLTSHFHRFGLPFINFLQFSVPAEGLSLLEGLLRVHGVLTSGFRGDVFLGNILMELLCVVLVSLKDTSLIPYLKGDLWSGGGGVMQDLIDARLNLSFLLEYLWSLAHALF